MQAIEKNRIIHSKSQIEALKRYVENIKLNQQNSRKVSIKNTKSTLKLPLYIYLNKNTHLNLLSLQPETLQKFHAALKNQQETEKLQQYSVIRRSKTVDGKKCLTKRLIVSEAEGQAFIAQDFHQRYLQNEQALRQFRKLKLLVNNSIQNQNQILQFQSRNDSKSNRRLILALRQANKEIYNVRKTFGVNQSMEKIGNQLQPLQKKQRCRITAEYLFLEIIKLERLVFAKSIVKLQTVSASETQNKFQNLVSFFNINKGFVVDKSFDFSAKKILNSRENQSISIFMHRTIYRKLIENKESKLNDQQRKIIQKIDRQYKRLINVDLLPHQSSFNYNNSQNIQKLRKQNLNKQQVKHVKVYFESAYPPFIMIGQQLKRIIGDQFFSIKLKDNQYANKCKKKQKMEQKISEKIRKQSKQLSSKNRKIKQQKTECQVQIQPKQINFQIKCHFCSNSLQKQQNGYVCNKKISLGMRNPSSFNDPFTYLTFYIDYRQFVKNNSYIHPFFQYHQTAEQQKIKSKRQKKNSMFSSNQYLCNRVYCQKCFDNNIQIHQNWPSCMFCSKTCICFRCQKMQRIVKMMARYLDNVSAEYFEQILDNKQSQKNGEIQEKVAAFLLKKLESITKYFVFPKYQDFSTIFDIKQLVNRDTIRQVRNLQNKEAKRARYVQPKVQILQRGQRPRKMVNKQFFQQITLSKESIKDQNENKFH